MTYRVERMSRRELRHALKRADKDFFADAMQYLEADSRAFGSGYVREMIWKYIKRYELGEADILRLELCALAALKVPMRREFKYMCQTMSRIGTPLFWNKVELLTESITPRVQVNAYCLYAYSKGIYAGEKQRMALKKLKFDDAMRHQGDFRRFTVSELLTSLKEPDHWRDGFPEYCEPIQSDLPILYYNPSLDMEFATLDLEAVLAEVLLPKLQQALASDWMGVFTTGAWLYTIYLLQKLNTPAAVPILANFLESKIEYKFDGPVKGLMLGAVLKVMRFYSTPEALAVVERHIEADLRYEKHYAGKSHGWLLTYP